MLAKLAPVLLAVVLAVGLTACGSGGGSSSENATATGDNVVALTGTDQLKFSKTELTANAGEIEVQLTCGDTVNHDFSVTTDDGDKTVVDCKAGQTNTGTIDLDPGTYTFFCDVPGHRAAGMEGTLTVK